MTLDVQISWQAQRFVNLEEDTSFKVCEPRSAEFVAGAALSEPRSADFVAGTALGEPRSADFVTCTAGTANLEVRFRGRRSAW